MAESKLITREETIVERIEKLYLDAKKNIFSIAYEFYQLSQNNKKAYVAVQELLDKNKVIPSSTIRELKRIAEAQNGFLIDNQDKLPLTHYTLYGLAKDIDSDVQYFNRLKDYIKDNSLRDFTKKEIMAKLQIVDDDFLSSQVETVSSEKNEAETEKSITIKLSKKDLNTNEKKILKDYQRLKDLMSYAEFEEHGQLEKLIYKDDE